MYKKKFSQTFKEEKKIYVRNGNLALEFITGSPTVAIFD